jgi:hypothetical protein
LSLNCPNIQFKIHLQNFYNPRNRCPATILPVAAQSERRSEFAKAKQWCYCLNKNKLPRSTKAAMLNSALKSSKRAAKPNRLKIEDSSRNWVALFTLITAGVSVLALLLQLVTLGNVFSLSKKPAPSLVQLSDGQAIKVKAIGSTERSLEVVQNFTTDSLIMLMSWTNELPSIKGQTGATDQGFMVKTKNGEKLITLGTFQASFVFSDQLRDELVKVLAEMTPPDVFKGSIKTTLKFQQVTIPTLVSEGKWRVNVIGTLLQYQPGRGDTVKVPFNKEVIVRSIDTPSVPAGGKFSNELEAVVYNIRQAGLEIVSMKDIESEPSQKSPELQPNASTPSSDKPSAIPSTKP